MPINSSWPRISFTTCGPDRQTTTSAASPGATSGGRPLATSASSGGTRRCALIGTAAPDGLSVVTLDHTGNLLIWDLDLHGYPDRPPSALATRYTRPDVTHFSADARYLAVGLLNAPASPKGVEIFDVAAKRSPASPRAPLRPGSLDSGIRRLAEAIRTRRSSSRFDLSQDLRSRFVDLEVDRERPGG